MPPLPRGTSYRPLQRGLAYRATANPYSRPLRQDSLNLPGRPDALLSLMHRTPLALQCATCPA